MTSAERDIEFMELARTSLELIRKKSQDYTAGADVLATFKQAGGNLGMDAKASVLHLIGIKVARLGSLFQKDREVKNEPVTDSVLDLFSYAFFLHCAVKDEQTKITEREEGKSDFDKGVYYGNRSSEKRETVVDEKVQHDRGASPISDKLHPWDQRYSGSGGVSRPCSGSPSPLWTTTLQ